MAVLFIILKFLIAPQNLYAQDIWNRIEYYSKDYKTGLKFFSNTRQIGVYSDSEGRFLIQENKNLFHTIDFDNHSKGIVTAWMNGSKTHSILVFNSKISLSSPICELPAWGDPQFAHKIDGKKLYIKIKEAQNKIAVWKLCYNFSSEK